MSARISQWDRFDGLVVTAVWDQYVEIQEGGRVRMIPMAEALERRNKAREALGAAPDEQQD